MDKTLCGMVSSNKRSDYSSKENGRMNSQEKAILARRYFERGYNCAQSVLLAFCEETELTEEKAAKLASGFGGGMGRMREICGAVSAMLMIEGLLRGYDDPNATEQKSELYARVRGLAEEFRKENGSIVCRDLLQSCETQPGFEPEIRTEAYYQRRPCTHYVECAARIAANAMKE